MSVYQQILNYPEINGFHPSWSSVEIAIGGEPRKLSAGQGIIMPANVTHALKALTPFKMTLVMIRA